MSNKVFKISLILLVILATLAVAELLVRKFNPKLTYSAAVVYSPDCYASDPLIPFTTARNYKCKMMNINGEYQTSAALNNLGYRGKEFTLNKSESKLRILVIGDSMTFGWGVSDDQTYPALLENIFKQKGVKNVEVINAGYKGALSPDGYYVYLKNEGLKLSPDIIILGLFLGNDITDLSGNIWERVGNDGLPEKVTSCCHTVDGHILRNKYITFKYRYPVLRESHLFILLMDILQQKFRLFPEQAAKSFRGEILMFCTLNPDCIHLFSPEEEKTLKLLAEMNNLAKEKGSTFLVAMLPVDLQLYREAKDKYARYNITWAPKPGEETFLQKRLGDYFDQNSINYLDLYQYLDKNRDRGYPFFLIDGHFNNLGTQLTAENISQYLLENKWLHQ